MHLAGLDEVSARRLSDLLMENVDPDQLAVSAFEQADEWAVEAIFRVAPDRNFLGALVQSAAGEKAAGRLVFDHLHERDWVTASLSGLSPVIAGGFFVHGAHDRHRAPRHRIAIEIEAALAFGTGHHGTTQGCLLALDHVLRSRKPRRGAGQHPSPALRILDVGTGTGILAIAAARALHRPVIATDIDPAAVAVARANAAHNRAGGLLKAYRTGTLVHRAVRAAGPYDIILANILARPLVRLSHAATRLLRPGGVIILSGLLPAHAAAVISAYRAQGLALRGHATREGWVTLVMRRSPKRLRPRR